MYNGRELLIRYNDIPPGVFVTEIFLTMSSKYLCNQSAARRWWQSYNNILPSQHITSISTHSTNRSNKYLKYFIKKYFSMFHWSHWKPTVGCSIWWIGLPDHSSVSVWMIMIALESGETVNRMSLVRFYLCKITLISDSCGEKIDNGIQNIRIKLRDVFYFYLHNDQGENEWSCFQIYCRAEGNTQTYNYNSFQILTIQNVIPLK